MTLASYHIILMLGVVSINVSNKRISDKMVNVFSNFVDVCQMLLGKLDCIMPLKKK